jgi:hypothetical protein
MTSGAQPRRYGNHTLSHEQADDRVMRFPTFIILDDDKRTLAFSELRSYYLFADRFGRPAKRQRQGQGRGTGWLCVTELHGLDYTRVVLEASRSAVLEIVTREECFTCPPWSHPVAILPQRFFRKPLGSKQSSSTSTHCCCEEVAPRHLRDISKRRDVRERKAVSSMMLS